MDESGSALFMVQTRRFFYATAYVLLVEFVVGIKRRQSFRSTPCRTFRT